MKKLLKVLAVLCTAGIAYPFLFRNKKTDNSESRWEFDFSIPPFPITSKKKTLKALEDVGLAPDSFGVDMLTTGHRGSLEIRLDDNNMKKFLCYCTQGYFVIRGNVYNTEEGDWYLPQQVTL